jgi:type II secretory pathway pseudopilin PulG
MAIVLVIIGLIMMTVFPALNAVRTSNQRALTESNLHNLMLATAAYVQANGCLPCPGNPAAIGASFGTTGNGVACGVCAAPEGIPPFAALEIPATTAHDGWGHWITMRVDPTLTANFGVKPPSGTTGMCAAAIVHNANSINVTTPGGGTQPAAVIFVSYGATGYGSYFAQAISTGLGGNGAQLPTPGVATPYTCAEGYAACNASQTTQFVDADYVAGSGYDDRLVYAGRNVLVSMFGNTSCSTGW